MEKFLKVVFWLYSFLIMIFSFSPPLSIEQGHDKILHFFAFFIFAILVKEAYKATYWGSFFYSLFFSVFIEVVQYFLPYRVADFGDVTADLLGATSGLFMYFVTKITYLEFIQKE